MRNLLAIFFSSLFLLLRFVTHAFALQRYSPSFKEVRLRALNAELEQGARTIAEWAKATYGAELRYSVKQVDCC